MIIGVSGVAGSGKSTTADFLANNHGFVAIALADPMKRFCREIFGFTNEQLWGPSSSRNAGDSRYIHRKAGSSGSTVIGFDANGSAVVEPFPREDIYLSPRHALQQLGTEWGRACYRNVWIEHGIKVAKILMSGSDEAAYTPELGLHYPKNGLAFGVRRDGVVFSDIRFLNELDAIKGVGGKTVRLKRGEAAEYSSHASEAEMQDVPDDYFDYVIDNRLYSLQELEVEVARMVRALSRGDR